MAEKNPTAAELESLKASNAKLQAELEALKNNQASVEKLQAELEVLKKSATTGVPFTGEYLEQYNAKVAAGLTPEQARAVTAEQIAHDERLAKAAKKA